MLMRRCIGASLLGSVDKTTAHIIVQIASRFTSAVNIR